ncbi:hypothetical protein KAJ27_05305, partial [bacterium]|nr:hypothetical protein [bacterium]
NSGKEGIVLDDYHAIAVQDKVAYRIWAAGTGHNDTVGGVTYFNGVSFHCYGNTNLYASHYIFRDGNYLWVYVIDSSKRYIDKQLKVEETRRGIFRLDIYNLRGLWKWQGIDWFSKLYLRDPTDEEKTESGLK